MSHDNDLGLERNAFLGWIVFGIRGNTSSRDFLDRKTFDIETNVVSWVGGLELGVMLFDGFDVSLEVTWGESNVHSWLENSGLDSSNWDGTNSRDLVDVLERESQSLVSWSDWGGEIIDDLSETRAFVEGHVVGLVDQILSQKSRNWNENHVFWFESGFFEEIGGLVFDFVESGLAVRVWQGLVHLIDSNDDGSDSESESQKSVLLGLSFSRDSSLKLSLGT